MLQPDWVLPAAAVLFLLMLVAMIAMRRRAGRSADRRLRAASIDSLAGFIIPNGDDGEIHVEYALLTNRGIIVVDIKDVHGNVFGSDSMQDWTVISDQRRFTFSNPQYALYDRLAAVRRCIPNVPVTGYVAFMNRGHFSKGRPSDVIQLDSLIDQLQREKKSGDRDALASWLPQWNLLRETAVAARVDHLMKN